MPTAQRHSGSPPQRVTTTFPFTSEAIDPHPLITVKLNDQVEATFGVDTGSYVSFISDQLVKELKLTPKPFPGIPGTPDFDPKDKNEFVNIATAQLGIFSLPGQDFIIKKEDQFSRIPSLKIDGIIGTDLLKYFTVAIDGPKHQITLWYPAGLTPEELVKAGFDHPWTVPITDPDNVNLYYATMRFTNGSITVVEQASIDTGAGTSYISTDIAQKLHLIPLDVHVFQILSGHVDVTRAS